LKVAPEITITAEPTEEELAKVRALVQSSRTVVRA
jgi:hypothetical protein